MRFIEYWGVSISCVDPDKLPYHLWGLDSRNELFLAPSARLAGLTGMGYFKSYDVAYAIAKHALPRLQKRYGPHVEFEVSSWKDFYVKGASTRVKKHEEVIQRYLDRHNIVVEPISKEVKDNVVPLFG